MVVQGYSVITLGSYLSLYFGLGLFFGGLYGLNIEINKHFTSHGKSDFLGISPKVVNFYVIFGFIGILCVIFVEEIIIDGTYGSNSQVSMFFCLILVFYKKINKLNPFLTNAILLTSLFLNIILVLPRLILLFVHLDSDSTFDQNVVYLLLNIPLQKSLSILGYSVYSDSSILKFYNMNEEMMAVNIAKNCSGLHSVAIFISAFFSYVCLTYRKFDFDSFLFCLLGIFLSYIANLLRMLIIVLVGIHLSIEAMLWTHHYLGWIIFTLWIFIFWEFYSKMRVYSNT
jgi:exosortase/archaeosortase family protein